jgi:hypothetical protein
MFTLLFDDIGLGIRLPAIGGGTEIVYLLCQRHESLRDSALRAAKEANDVADVTSLIGIQGSIQDNRISKHVLGEDGVDPVAHNLTHRESVSQCLPPVKG